MLTPVKWEPKDKVTAKHNSVLFSNSEFSRDCDLVVIFSAVTRGKNAFKALTIVSRRGFTEGKEKGRRRNEKRG